MRLPKLLTWVIFCAACACFVGSAPAQQPAVPARVAGRIVVARVAGTVTATNTLDKTTRPLTSKDVITQNYVVTTAGDGSAVLVFSNGATVNVGANSVLSIDEFLQDPFDQDLQVSNLKEEPSSSVTKLNLTRGELVGNVKHLHEDKGSSFTVNTPVGAAGIRGTTFRIVFVPDASGHVTFSLQTADGRVLFTGTTNTQVPVEAGKQITATVDVKVDAATNAVTVTSAPTITATQTITAEAQTTIAAATQEAVEAAKTVIIQATTSPNSSGGSQNDNSSGGTSDNTKKDSSTTDKNSSTTDNSSSTTGDNSGGSTYNPGSSTTGNTGASATTSGSKTTSGDGQE